MMHRLKACVSQIPLLCLYSVAIGADQPIQWQKDTGGNGHWYAFDPQPHLWPDARDSAVQRGADLASLQTEDEAAWLWSIHVAAGLGHAAIGLYQDLEDPAYQEPAGGWRWVDGSPVAWDGWQPGEPNDYFGGEHFGNLGASSEPAYFNDFIPAGALPSWIEWSADCNGDGIVDYGQILAGELDDLDGNGVPDCCDQGRTCFCPADLDGSATVGFTDLLVVLSAWGPCDAAAPCPADLAGTGDGIVSFDDLLIVLSAWGPCP